MYVALLRGQYTVFVVILRGQSTVDCGFIKGTVYGVDCGFNIRGHTTRLCGFI